MPTRNEVTTILEDYQPIDFSILTGNARLAIYGAGRVGREVAKILNKHHLTIDCFLDRQAQSGMTWNDIPILLPNANNVSSSQRAATTVIVAVFNRDADVGLIIQELQELGYNRVLSFVAIFDLVAKELGNWFWLTERAYYLSHAAAIEKAATIWADEASRELYLSVMKFRMTGDYSLLPTLISENEYFQEDLLRSDFARRFVDCGAYNGDTIFQLCRLGREVEAVAAFEPDQANFVELAKFGYSARVTLPQEIYLWPCGVYSSSQQLRFSSGQGEGSKVSEEGTNVIQCVALDEAIPSFKPTLIKMDIEGAEYEALLGAQKLLKANRPDLAICVYHYPEHLWQLPLLIAEWQLNYKLYLRSHSYNCLEMVLYAVAQ